MSNETIYIASAVLVGLGATLVMDLWALFVRRVFSIASLNYCFVGRWLLYMTTGILKHASIAASPRKSAECTVGWITHYLIGAAFALILVISTSGRWLEQPTLLPALLVGIGTVIIPFLIMQPSFGLGVAGAKTLNPIQTRLKSLMAHTSFGVGLYLCALPLSQLLHAA